MAVDQSSNPQGCKVCGQSLAGKSQPAKYCSKKCSSAARFLSSRGMDVTPEVYFDFIENRRCEHCGLAIGRGDSLSRRYCSSRCVRRASHGRYKLATAGSPTRREIVGDRDGWMCYLCGGNIDPDLWYPHGRAMNSDHLIPRTPPVDIAPGGDHLVNFGATHFECNRKKADRIIVPAMEKLIWNIAFYGERNVPRMYVDVAPILLDWAKSNAAQAC